MVNLLQLEEEMLKSLNKLLDDISDDIGENQEAQAHFYKKYEAAKEKGEKLLARQSKVLISIKHQNEKIELAKKEANIQ